MPLLAIRALQAAAWGAPLLLVAWALGGSSTGPPPLEESQLRRMPCIDEIRHLGKHVVWYGAGHRAWLEAESACSDRFGAVYELRHVRLSFYSGDRRVAELTAPSGLLREKADLLVLTDAVGPAELPCLAHPSALSLDLRQGRLRGPGLLWNLGARASLRCGVFE